ncbi:hypothetical protein D7X12_00140 [Corallococcus sicarius]|uniref:Uncharacterized protein n=2 Tax=Corallococcus sicarius TaxID=2316726 RepID=A0A3A8P9A8_9BACT|nr:hypothetical protein D7X12_00140 [Corallococcus sicarius]
MSMRRLPFRLPRSARWALTSTVMLAAPQALAASSCPQPELTECSNVEYRASACGQEYDGYCQGLMETEWKVRYESAPTRTAIIPKSLGGGVATVAVQDRPVVTSTFEGSDETVVGQIQRGQVLARKGYKNLTEVEKAYAEQRKGWDDNETLARSCQEYVHEKHYDYSRFEQEAGQFGDDYRALFTAAYGSEGIAERTLFSKDGEKLPPLWDGDTRVEKNAYFRFEPGEYPKGTQAYTFSTEAALKANNPEGRKWVAPTDGWHLSMSEALSETPDDVLNDSQQRQEKFTALLGRRDAVYLQWQRASEALKARDFDTAELDAQTAERLYALDKAIEVSLVRADKEGCLTTEKTTACDWSPRRYKAMVDAVMVPRREADLGVCLTLTGNDFGAESFVRNADRLKIEGLDQGDYTRSPQMLQHYLRTFATWLAQQPEPVQPATMTKRHAQDVSAGGYAGSNDFGGGYSLRAGWEVTTPGTAFTGNWCDTNASVSSELTLYANVFSPVRTELAHLEGRAFTEPSAVRVQVGARLLGYSIFTYDHSQPTRFTFVQSTPFVDQDAVSASTTFMVWFIPVTVKGGLSAEVGIRTTLGGAVTRDCTQNLIALDLIGNVGPYAIANGFADVGIGVPGLRVGVRGELVILDFNLPLEGNVGIALSNASHPTNPNTLFLSLGLNLDMTMKSLGGKLSLFGELLFLKAEFPIVSWTGVGTSQRLFSDQYYLPLAQLY